MVSIVEATTSKEQPNSKWDYTYNLDEPISFNERGIQFYVFQDGEMDFDIHRNDYGNTTDYYYKGAQRKLKSRGNQNIRGTKVVRDYRGRVIRVGRVFINYNYKGDVSRIGSVFISYRRNHMTRVGGLRIIHDRYGVRYVGSVKSRRNQYNTGYYNSHYGSYSNYFYDNYVYDYQDDFFTNDDFYNNYEAFKEDDNYYYYRSKGTNTKKIRDKSIRKQKMIKRKKSTSDKVKKRKKIRR